MLVKHLSDPLFLMDISLETCKKVPFFNNFFSQTETELETEKESSDNFLYFPITMDADKEMILLFFQFLESESESESKIDTMMPKTSTSIYESSELLKIAFALECEEWITFFSERIFEIFLSLDMEETFGIKMSREFMDQVKDPDWKKCVQENLLETSKPKDFFSCIYSLPYFLKRKIYECF